MAKVYVFFWFDVEDYITPQSDEALKRLLEIFERQNVRGTFKLVGEKLRVLKKRNRKDILEKLRHQDIGYHTDFHSKHPTVSEYLKDLGWEEGVREFEIREKEGVDDIERIFGRVPSCYGQPGGAWAPQVYEVMKKWRIPIYLDETNHIGLNSQPFWYCGILNILNLRSNCTRVSLKEGKIGLEKAKKEFQDIYEKLHSQGGTISIYYHPCEFVTNEFWDKVNFAEGKNTHPSEYQPSPLKSSSQVEEGFKLFEDYLSCIKAYKDLEIVTAQEAPAIYPDLARQKEFSLEEIKDLFSKVEEELTYQVLDKISLSLAELFCLASSFLNSYIQNKILPQKVIIHQLMGPGERIEGIKTPFYFSWDSFAKTCIEVERYLRKVKHTPEEIFIEEKRVTPADFFFTAAKLIKKIIEDNHPPTKIKIRQARIALEKYVTGKESWGWVIFPKGFNAPKVINLGKLQTWTLKPALID